MRDQGGGLRQKEIQWELLRDCLLAVRGSVAESSCLAVSAFIPGQKRLGKKREREREIAGREGWGCTEKGKAPNNVPLLFSIGTINTILKCYRNLRSLF